jgi:hypothetical protein
MTVEVHIPDGDIVFVAAVFFLFNGVCRFIHRIVFYWIQ